jgi:hypothetical protein
MTTLIIINVVKSITGPIFDDYIDNYQCSHQDKAKNLEIFSQNQHKHKKLKKVKGFIQILKIDENYYFALELKRITQPKLGKLVIRFTFTQSSFRNFQKYQQKYPYFELRALRRATNSTQF